MSVVSQATDPAPGVPVVAAPGGPYDGVRGLVARHPVIAYCLLAFPAQILIVLSQHYEIRNHGLSSARIFIPAVSGLLVALVGFGAVRASKLLTSLVNFRVPLKYWLFALLYPSFVAVIALGGLHLFGIGHGIHIDLIEVRYLRFFILSAKISASEEIGWVGLMTAVIATRYRLLHTACIVGLLWGLWYFPLVFAKIQVVDGLPLVPLLIHFMAIAAICAWLYQRTGSALVVFVMQVTTNYTSQIIPVLPLRGGIAQYDAFVAIKVVFALALYVFWGPKPMFGRLPPGTVPVPPGS